MLLLLLMTTSLVHIKEEPIITTNNILKEQIEQIAFEYLMNKKGSKGKEMNYSEI